MPPSSELSGGSSFGGGGEMRHQRRNDIVKVIELYFQSPCDGAQKIIVCGWNPSLLKSLPLGQIETCRFSGSSAAEANFQPAAVDPGSESWNGNRKMAVRL
jgi:hypothetical protein